MDTKLRRKVLTEIAEKTPAGLIAGRDIEATGIDENTLALKIDANPETLVLIHYDEPTDRFAVNKVILTDIHMTDVPLEELAAAVYDGVTPHSDGDGDGGGDWSNIPFPPEGSFRAA